MTCSKPWVSWRWPAVTHTARMMPWLSQTRGVFVPNPPRERPRAWSCGSCICIDSGPLSCAGEPRFFFRPSGGRVGAVDGAVETPQIAVDEARSIELEQQRVKDLGPCAVFTPAVEAVVDGLPGAITLRRVGPGGASMQMPKDAVNKGAMVLPGTAPVAVVITVVEGVGNPLPLRIGKVKAVVHGSLPGGNLLARKRGSPAG